jgi:truncated hemoglobin YjbI
MEAEKPNILTRLGGVEAISGLLVRAVEIFYLKLIKDPVLQPFFVGVVSETCVRWRFSVPLICDLFVLSISWHDWTPRASPGLPTAVTSSLLLQDMAKLRAKQVQFLAFVFGGPNKYSGRDLAAAHAELIEQHGLVSNAE